MWIITNTISKIFDFIFPTYCFVCKKENKSICDKCLNNFSLSVDQINSYTYSHYSYKDENVRKIIKSIKYYHKKNLISTLVSPIIREADNFFKQENLLLVPIPMTRTRNYLRGGNHAEKIAKTLSKELHVPCVVNLLKRKSETKRQVKAKTKSNRLKNQKGSFILKNINQYKDKNIILVDDVTTTGATINEARKILIENGFKNVKAITLAH